MPLRLGAQGIRPAGRKTIMRILRSAAGLLLALATPVAAQTLPELSAAMGAHHQAAAIGSGSASTARRARETITRHLPKRGGGWDVAGGPTRTASAGRGRGSWRGPGKRSGGGSGWARGSEPRRKRGR
jgi:hypothetical protein